MIPVWKSPIKLPVELPVELPVMALSTNHFFASKTNEIDKKT